MYLTAQRVVAPASGQTGINAYCYSHGATTWTVPPPGILDDPPEDLLAERIEVIPPGNRVRSFLDIAVPDGATAEELGQAFQAFIEVSRGGDLPWTGAQARCAFRVGMEQSLAAGWRAEVAALLHAVAQSLLAANES